MPSFLIGLQIVAGLFATYVCFSFVVLFTLYYPIPCTLNATQCLKNYVVKTPHPPLKLWVYTSTTWSPKRSDLYPVWELNDFKPNENFTKDVTVRIPFGMHNKGTMFVHVFLAPVEGGRGKKNPFDADWVVNKTGILTYYTHLQATKLQVNSDDPVKKEKLVTADQLTCHWRSLLTLNVVTDDVVIFSKDIPKELTDYIRPHEDQYLPILLIDEMRYRTKDLLPLNITCKEMPLTISYTPVSYVKFRLWMIMNESINENNNGLTERDKDNLKGILITQLPNVFLTGILLSFHLLFVLLAYESDISFWQERKTMAGLSTQTVVWRSISILVIFLYMLDKRESVIIITAVGCASLFEIWRVLKVFKARVCLTEWRLVFGNVVVGDRERETQALDSQAMTYLSYVMFPSWIAVIIYTVMYNFQKSDSVFSWCIQSLFNGFYCFGFLFMLPQVFINYKLKSVADLPWEVLMFRAFSAIISDICRFIVMIPIENDGACFLDEVIFVIYLYQGWLYSH